MKPRILLATALALAAFLVPPLAQGAVLKGEVLETLDAAGYTYLRLKTKDGEVWAAVSKVSVPKGAQVTLETTVLMENFESKALKRKFDRVIFASLADPSAKPAAVDAPRHGSAPAPAKPVGKIAKARAADAKSIAEVQSGRAALKDKTVTVRGQVVKASTGILGKNWIHLQDGTGEAAKATHDLVVTTTDTVAVGDIVSASGTVRTDVDLGSGYKYAVLVEDAKVRK